MYYCLLTTLGLVLGYRPAHRTTAQAGYSCKVWPRIVNYREGSESKMTMVLSFLRSLVRESLKRQLQGQPSGGGGWRNESLSYVD